jgi:hypothetical protein
MSSFSTLEASLRTLQAIAESYRGQMTPLVEQELLVILAKALAHKSHGAREAAFYLAAALATCIAGIIINPIPKITFCCRLCKIIFTLRETLLNLCDFVQLLSFAKNY